MNCPSCAHATPDGSLFCDACGAKLELICAACGDSNQPGARFCKKCGARLASESDSASAIAPAASERRVPLMCVSRRRSRTLRQCSKASARR